MANGFRDADVSNVWTLRYSHLTDLEELTDNGLWASGYRSAVQNQVRSVN